MAKYRLTKIYTRTGDDGTTGLFGGGRLSKSDIRIEAYGTVDEVNSCIGLARAEDSSHVFESLLAQIQIDLFVLGADLATPLDAKITYSIPRIEQPDVERLEHAIDEHVDQLPELTKFVMPGGSLLSSHFHVARTVARRAERLVVELALHQELGEYDIRYLNRLSDLLFVLARRANQVLGVSDVEWDGKKA